MNDDPARGRFFVIQLLRLSGVAFVLVGIAILYDAIDLPDEAGYVILVIGVLDALIAPIMLARAWKTPLP